MKVGSIKKTSLIGFAFGLFVVLIAVLVFAGLGFAILFLKSGVLRFSTMVLIVILFGGLFRWGGRVLSRVDGDRLDDEEKLRIAEERYRALFEQSPDGVVIIDPETARMTDFNEKAHRQLGYSREEFSTLSIRDIDAVETSGETQSRLEKVKSERRQDFDTRHRSKQGEIRDVRVTAQIVMISGQPIYHCIWRDITEQKTLEARRELAMQVLATLNRESDTAGLIGDILQLIQKHTRVEAVGIRLSRGGDFPFFETRGFSTAFVESETALCAADEAGALIREEDGGPCLECLCGDVLSGRLDPDSPGVTPHGSFWTNGSSAYIGSLSQGARPLFRRNRCLREGYESIALIPLRSGAETIGLIQLDDHQKDRFTADGIRFLEGIGASVGIALARRQAWERDQASHAERRRLLDAAEESRGKLLMVVAELKKAGEALTNERNLLYALMDNLPDRVFFKDADSRFTKISKAHAASLGLRDPTEAIGKTDGDFTPREIAEQTQAEERRLLELGRPVIAKVEKRVKGDGQAQWHSIVKAPIKDQSGRVTGLVGIARDITQEIELQQQLQQALKMDAIGRLAGGVAHDFNNLLQAILGFTELLLERADHQTSQYSDLKEIESAARRAAELTRQLLAFSRKQRIEPRVMDLNQAIAATEKMLRRILGENIRIDMQLEPDLIRVCADPGQIDQIIMNLAVNAQDAMPDGGRLHLATSNVELKTGDVQSIPEAQAGAFVCLAVSDSGRGMTPDVQSHLFEPFYTTKGLGKGTGLGLAVIYGIVKQHGGWINVYSQLGIGSTFKVYLPAYQGMAGDPVARATVEESLSETLCGHGERVLLVEDERGVRNLATHVLEASGYTVLACESAEEALSVFERESGRFDLVFSDVVLPGRNGIELVDLLQAKSPDLPALLCSGYTDSRARWSVIEDRHIPFLQKPYPSAALLRAFRNVLDGRVKPVEDAN